MTYQPVKPHKLASFQVDEWDGFTTLKYWDGNEWATKRTLNFDIDQICAIAEFAGVIAYDELFFDDDNGWTLVTFVFNPMGVHDLDQDEREEVSAVDALQDLDEQDWAKILPYAIADQKKAEAV